MQRHLPSPFDQDADEPLTFSEVTVLALLAMSALAVAAVLLLGIVTAAHRIAAVLGRV